MPMTKEQRIAHLAKARAIAKANREARKAQEVPRDAAPQLPDYEPVMPPPSPEPAPQATVPEEDEKILRAIAAAAEAGVVEPDPNKPETIPPNLFGGFTKRLELADKDPDKMYWWCNDDKGGTTIGNALKTGWKFVERKDVRLNAAVTPRNNALGSYVRQHVGTDEAGNAMYAYAMWQPKWLYELQNFGPGSREEYHRKLEAQIRAGTIGMKQGEKRYTAEHPYPGAGPSNLPATQLSSGVVRGKSDR